MATSPHSTLSNHQTDLQSSLRSLAQDTLATTRTTIRQASRGPSSAGGGRVDGLGVTLVVGEESLYAGSDAFTDAVDQVQYGLGEGPCVSATATRRVVTTTRIGAGERRWARFVRGATPLMLRSVKSVPVIAGDEVIGSLNVYSRSAHGLIDLTPAVLRRMARAAQVPLDGMRVLALAGAGAQVLAQALDDRAEVEHATGALMDRYRSNANQARTLLTLLAHHDSTSAVEAARTVLGSAAGADEAGASCAPQHRSSTEPDRH